MFQHLDTVIAFGALMLAASLVVTAGTQLVISLLGLRGANLRSSLGDLLENSSADRDARRYGRVIAHRVLRHPLVSDSAFSRFALRIEKLPFVPAEAAGKLRWAGSGLPLQPWLLGAFGGFFLWPATRAILDRLTSLDLNGFSVAIARYIPFLNLYDHPWRSGLILGAVFGGLLSRWRLATSIRFDELLAVLEKLSAPPDGTLPDPAQRAMLVIAGERRGQPRPNSKSVSAQIERIRYVSPEESEGGVAVAVENAVAQDSVQADQRLVGLAMWFDRVMERAAQRLTLQARAIAVVLSFLLVFGAHLDAVRLFHSLSSDAQSRAQLAASADAMVKQAEQLPRGKEAAGLQGAKDGAQAAVPDIYRSAMAAVLAIPPSSVSPAEPSKPKAHGASHSSAAKATSGSSLLPGIGSAESNEVQISATSVGNAGDGVQVTPAVSQSVVESSPKERDNKAAGSAKLRTAAKEPEKSAPGPREDAATIAAKVRAGRALEARPGFASREDAVLWLRGTLYGDPALQNLTAAYEQEVNSDLKSDGDKLLDHSASIKRELARSQVRLLPEEWTGWTPNQGELPGLLISVAFLSLGAALCYNALKSMASLRPMPAIKQYK
jgi:hypothetical protein